MDTRRAGVPTGTCVAASYGQGIAPVGSSLALVPAGAVLIQSNEAEWVPPFELDEKHCHYVLDEKQCGSWPMKNDPDGLCVGHRRKANASGPDPGPDSDVRTISP